MSKKDNMTLWLEGERELYANMQKRMDLTTDAGKKALQKAGLAIVNKAKENLRNNKSVVTGMLRASGKVQTVQGDPDAVDAGFFGDNSKNGYAFFVEFGRRAGKMPPPGELAQWVRKKLRVADMKTALARGWAIAKNIAKKGTKPHPFFRPAIESTKSEVEAIFREAVKKETDKNE